MQELIFFRKILPGFNLGSVNFPHNMQGFKFEGKKEGKRKCGVHILVGIWQQYQLKRLVHAKIYPNEVFVLMLLWCIIQGLDLVLVL